MKRILALLFVSVLIMGTTHAQISVGVKGGLTISNLSYDVGNWASADYAFGGHAAVFLRTGKGLFSFQPEFMFIQKGSRINSTSDATYSQLSMNYFDLPLLLRITIGIKVVEVYFNLGPYGGYWFSGKTKNYYYDDSQGVWITNKDNYEFDDDHDVRFDAGLVGGVGVKVLMILLELRYGQGFIDVFDYKDNNNKELNRYFNVTLGVQI